MKLDHHFNERISLNGVYLYQKLGRAERQLLPRRALRRAELLHPARRQRVRAQQHLHHESDDGRDVPLRHEHVRGRQHACRSSSTRRQLGWDPAFANSLPVQKFPPLTLTGYAGTGYTGVSDTELLLMGRQRFGHEARGLAQLQDRRRLPDPRRRCPELRPVGRLVHVQRSVHRQQREQPRGHQPERDRRPAARLSIRRHARAATAGSTTTCSYYGGFVQDDWRVTDKLTVNYGVRLEHETGLAERNNQLVVGFDRERGEPAQRHHSCGSGGRHAGATGARRPGVRRAERRERARSANAAGGQVVAARRRSPTA